MIQNFILRSMMNKSFIFINFPKVGFAQSLNDWKFVERILDSTMPPKKNRLASAEIK
jgi:hypothetical protein